ncbi:hypothetical protein ACHQM5_005928 [Ranunculus cassubicifolius]
MAVSKRSSPIQLSSSTRDLKQRVISCLNKLSDRDTYTIAITELESIAQNLSHDSFGLYLNCIYYTDPTQKLTVRKQCARLLGFMAEIHRDSLSPFVMKMIGNVIKRLRDSDSSVRSTLVESVAMMASQISRPPFSVFLKPLMEAISVEQDQSAQIGSALCLAAAIENAPSIDVPQLQRLIPKLMKLCKSESFKAKPALLTLIGSIVGSGAVSNSSLIGHLVPLLVEFLSSEDWAARKASAEALEKLAVVETNLVSEFKSSCLSTFEAKRFDRVKAVREAITQMIEAWKDVPDVSDEISPRFQSKTSLKENVSDGRFGNSVTPQSRKVRSPINRSSPTYRQSAAVSRERSPRKTGESKSTPALFRKLDRKKPANWKVEVAVPNTPPSKTLYDNGIQERGKGVQENAENEDDRRQTRRSLFNRSNDDKMHKFGGLRSGSRVVPLQVEDCLESTVVVNNNVEDLHATQKNSEDLSLIRKQLIQIENQQSSLLDLLQRFMGNSQNGMQSLETRVQGLEVALDEISYDLAVSTGRMSNPESAGNTCCMLPGAEFLSSMFWRKTDGRYSTSRLLGTPVRTSMRSIAGIDGIADSSILGSRRFRYQAGGGLVVNPLADISSRPREGSDLRSNRLPRAVNTNVPNVASSAV